MGTQSSGLSLGGSMANSCQGRMRSRIVIGAAVAAATALASVSLALAGMHATLGAHLSGMGEHGIVNLQSHESKGQLCWKFQLSVMHVTGATVRDAHGMIVAHLGHMYSAKGCAMVSKTALTRRLLCPPNELSANPSGGEAAWSGFASRIGWAATQLTVTRSVLAVVTPYAS
jgi:hypothetical protein